MVDVAVPEGVTRKTARELRRALVKIIPMQAANEEAFDEVFHDRVQYALYELFAAMDASGVGTHLAVEMVMLMSAQVLSAAEGVDGLSNRLRGLAATFEQDAAGGSGGAGMVH